MSMWLMTMVDVNDGTWKSRVEYNRPQGKLESYIASDRSVSLQFYYYRRPLIFNIVDN